MSAAPVEPKSRGLALRGAHAGLMLPVVLTLAACTLVAAAVAAPTPHSERARLGVFGLTLSYLETTQHQSSVFEGKRTTFTTTFDNDFRVTLLRAGKTLLSRSLGCAYCVPAGLEADRPQPSLHFVRLEPQSQPTALVDLFTGGAHCCFVSYLLTPNGGHVELVRELWGDPGYRLADLGDNGRLEFVTADDRFAYAFTAYAASLLPLRILSLEGTRLVDVTRSYPAELESDARAAWRLYLQVRRGPTPDVRGVLAAWAADEARLGDWKSATAALAVALRQGELAHGPAIAGWPIGRAYLTALQRFLTRLGYL
jgi:hypothetical protein